MAPCRGRPMGREPIFSPALQDATDIRVAPKDKAAFALAQRFESDILLRSDDQAANFGSEEGLAQRYAISRKTVRQALRILEARSLGRMRRGHGGGLQLQRPSQHEISRFMAIHLFSNGVGVADVVAARHWLIPLLENNRDDALVWAAAMFDALEAEFAENESDQADEGENRALLIARRIMRDFRLTDSAAEGRWLGSIEDLEERHASDRRVVLQALRVLEDLELVAVQRGRNGGLVATQPSPGAIARFTYPYFVLSGMSQALSGDLIWSINKINAAMAAQRLSDDVSRRLQDVLSKMDAHSFENGDFSQQVTMWRVLADASDNRVLHMLIRCLFYYQIHSGIAPLEENQPIQANTIFLRTLRICRAVLAANPVAAVDAVSNLENISRGGLASRT